MADKELWVLMRLFDELSELEKAEQIRVVKYLLARFDLGKLVTSDATTEQTITIE